MNRFNLIEVGIKKSSTENKITAIGIYFNKFVILKNSPVQEMMKFFSDLRHSKHSKFIFYTQNLTVLFLYLFDNLGCMSTEFEIKFLIERQEVYYLRFEFKNKNLKLEITIKCFEKLLGKIENLQLPSIEWNKLLSQEENLQEFEKKFKSNTKIILFILKFVDDQVYFLFNQWNSQSLSISSIALNIFLINFNRYKVEIRLSKQKDSLFRKAYYGPRCEVFGNRKSKNEFLFHYDYTLMYGHIMLENFPIKKLKKEEIKNLSLPLKPGFYNIEVESEKLYIPVLPLKVDDEGSIFLKKNKQTNTKILKPGLFFPNGTFTTNVWYEELELFLQMGGRVTKINEAYTCDTRDLGPIFKEYASYGISRALKNNQKIQKIFWKLLIVSLYGRLGMQERTTETVLIHKSKYQEHTKTKNIINEHWRGDYGIVEWEKDKNKTKDYINSNVMHAAIITSKARIKLYKTFQDISKNNGRLLYCDTDSVFVAYKKNVIGETHGNIKWDENSKLDDAIFASIRTYAIIKNNQETTKIASVPRNSISFADFYNGFNKHRAPLYRVTMNKYTTFSFSQWKSEIYVDIANYDKRKFIENGTATKPWFKINKGFIEDPSI